MMRFHFKGLNMLVLLRDEGESIIMVADNKVIKITALKQHGKSARIGIEAPKSVSIDREEIFIKKIEDGTICVGI